MPGSFGALSHSLRALLPTAFEEAIAVHKEEPVDNFWVKETTGYDLSPYAEELPLCEDMEPGTVGMGDSCWSSCHGRGSGPATAHGRGAVQAEGNAPMMCSRLGWPLTSMKSVLGIQDALLTLSAWAIMIACCATRCELWTITCPRTSAQPWRNSSLQRSWFLRASWWR
ncbi:unnamed protein product [Effrenium voratum]|nr:unnamed protein product [Effrenium voratum]